MEYLTNWTDTSSIVQTGWSGSVGYSDGNLIFTATNGWHSCGWNLESIVDKDIVIEFDYIFTDVTNWGSTISPFIINGDSVNYLSPLKYLEKTTTEWKHLYCKINSAKKFIGVNVRGTGNTGNSIVMKLSNVRIHDAQSINSSFSKNGITSSNIFLETGGVVFCTNWKRLSLSNRNIRNLNKK